MFTVFIVLQYFEGMAMMNEMMKGNGEMKPMSMHMSNQTMDMNSIIWVAQKAIPPLGGAIYSCVATLPIANNSLSSDTEGPISGDGGFAVAVSASAGLSGSLAVGGAAGGGGDAMDVTLVNSGKITTGGYGLDLEITETGLLHDVEGASRKLRELRTAGMRVAIDDFGTGYSSLGLLSKLPVDLLKIDRTFISGLPADPASGTLVSSIIGLASAFNLVTSAEGVETEEQLDLLRKLKCNHSQGFLHARAVPAEQLEQMLARQHKRPMRRDLN